MTPQDFQAMSENVPPLSQYEIKPGEEYSSASVEIKPITQSITEKQPRIHPDMAMARFADQYELPEDPIPEHVETKKHIRVPQIQSMDDYIKRHYTRELMTGMVEDIELRAGNAEAIFEVYDDTFQICRMLFWRRSYAELIVRLKMQLNICSDVGKGISTKANRYEYAAEMYFDFSDEIEYKEMIYCPYHKRTVENIEAEYNDSMWPLDHHLIPFAKKEAIEKRAWEMHCSFYPEESGAVMPMPEDIPADDALDDQTAKQRKMERRAAIMHEYSAFDLARRMGLAVVRVALYRQNKRKSFFNFRESQVQVLQEGTDGESKEPIWITIPVDTIVLNAFRYGTDDGEMSVFHECIHWYWHYLFYRLQALHNSDISALQKSH